MTLSSTIWCQFLEHMISPFDNIHSMSLSVNSLRVKYVPVPRSAGDADREMASGSPTTCPVLFMEICRLTSEAVLGTSNYPMMLMSYKFKIDTNKDGTN